MSLYISQPISVSITCSITGASLSDASSVALGYEKPGGTTGSWTATLNGSVLEYDITAAQNDESGVWILQPLFTFASGVIPGTKCEMEIKALYT